MKQQVLYQKTDTLRLTIYESNRPIVPTSATITLYSAGTNTVLQAEASATVDATTGEMTYSLTTTHTATLGLNYKAVWKYVYNSVTYYETQLFDVVRSILSIPITDDDLYAELPSLSLANVQNTGTATSATSSTLVDTAKRKEVDNYWKGGLIEILSGTGSKQRRDITSFTQSSSSFSVTPNWVTTPDSTSVYRVVKSWTRSIQNGFEKIEQMLYDKGKRDALILESSQIKMPLIYIVLQTICMDLRDNENDKWDLLQKDYSAKFEKSFGSLALDYDEDNSGTIDAQEEQENITSIRIFRS